MILRLGESPSLLLFTAVIPLTLILDDSGVNVGVVGLEPDEGDNFTLPEGPIKLVRRDSDSPLTEPNFLRLLSPPMLLVVLVLQRRSRSSVSATALLREEDRE